MTVNEALLLYNKYLRYDTIRHAANKPSNPQKSATPLRLTREHTQERNERHTIIIIIIM